jgi:DNA primase
MTTDTRALRQRTDLLALIGYDTRLKRVAGTAGGEYAGPCPFCGGRDRFRVQPEQGRWWCRRCGGERWQDAIDYVRKRDGVEFAEACRLLGASPSELGASMQPWPRPSTRPRATGGQLAQRHSAPVVAVELAEDQEPTLAWQAQARVFLEEVEQILWSAAGERARAYLRRRGLGEETLRAWRIGFQPDDARRDEAARWGFPARTPTGDPAWLRIPRGIVIPWLLRDAVWQLKIRTNREQPKYLAISGGHPCLYGADTLVPGEPAVLAEGEFDTLLLWQEAGDLVGTATLGSCTRRVSPGALRCLLGCASLLLPYDADDEGDRGAERLCRLLPRARRLRPPLGKDLTHFWQLGGRVRDWMQFELAWGGAAGRPLTGAVSNTRSGMLPDHAGRALACTGQATRA